MRCKALNTGDKKHCRNTAVLMGYCLKHYTQRELGGSKYKNWKMNKELDKFGLVENNNHNV